MKRSTSNPLLYFNERRDNIMEVREDRKGARGHKNDGVG